MGKTVVRQAQIDPSIATETEVEADIESKIGAPNGAAPLDENSKVPLANLPDPTSLVTTIDGGVF